MALVNATSIKATVNKYLIDDSITISGTYRSVTKNYNTTTAEMTDTTSEFSVRVLPSKFTEEEIANSGGYINANDGLYFIRAKDFEDEGVEPKKEDELVCDGLTWQIKDWEEIKVGSTLMLYAFHCIK
jgi:hypothetical protein